MKFLIEIIEQTNFIKIVWIKENNAYDQIIKENQDIEKYAHRLLIDKLPK